MTVTLSLHLTLKMVDFRRFHPHRGTRPISNDFPANLLLAIRNSLSDFWTVHVISAAPLSRAPTNLQRPYLTFVPFLQAINYSPTFSMMNVLPTPVSEPIHLPNLPTCSIFYDSAASWRQPPNQSPYFLIARTSNITPADPN